jgi:hypothetical protein
MTSVINLILNELTFIQKDVYKDGTQHSIYKDHKDADKVYKVVKPEHKDVSKQAYDWIKVFRENPKYFPKVYKYTDRGASVERLDANKAHKEFNEIQKALNKVMDRGWSFEGLLKDIAEGDYSTEDLNKAGHYLLKEIPELALAFKRFTDLMLKIKNLNSPDYTLDAHAGNFGYDKQGNLKMLDI